MRVLVVGGGSGGHITPAVATIRELLELKPRAKVEFWTDRKYYKNVVKLTTLGEGAEEFSENRKRIRVRKVCSGKFRRYAGWGIKDYFKNFSLTLKDLVLKNIVGFFGFLAGLIQSFFRLAFPGKEGKFDVIFLKGGFVGLPVGIVARLLRIPYVIHESDTVPGLANRILMKRAAVVATGSSFEAEFIEKFKIRGRAEWVGIPIGEEFRKVGVGKEKSYKKTFGFEPEKPLVVITGGSQGAENINNAVKEILPELLKFTSVGLVAGRKHFEELVELKKYEEWEDAKLKSNFRMWEFNSTMNELMGAADLVVSRAGATTIAELAALRKAVVLVPFERLPGGHQVKNAEKLEKEGAVKVIKDERMMNQPGILLKEIEGLIKGRGAAKKREELAENLGKTAKKDAAKRLAEILVEISGSSQNFERGAKFRKATGVEQGREK